MPSSKSRTSSKDFSKLFKAELQKGHLAEHHLYTSSLSPNGRRVDVLLHEKQLQIPTTELNLIKLEHKSPHIKKLNPFQRVPFLVLPDGSTLTESLAICRYLEGLKPIPNLFGKTALETAQIDMWIRRIEFSLFLPIAFVFRNSHPKMAKLEEQIPAMAKKYERIVTKSLKELNSLIKNDLFLAINRFSMADIILITSLEFSRYIKADLSALKHLEDYKERVGKKACFTWPENTS